MVYYYAHPGSFRSRSHASLYCRIHPAQEIFKHTLSVCCASTQKPYKYSQGEAAEFMLDKIHAMDKNESTTSARIKTGGNDIRRRALCT
jgi:hypothetical protein